MESIRSDTELLSWWDDLTQSFTATRGTLQREAAFMLCYVEGLQWTVNQASMQRLVPQRNTVIDPSSRDFRAVVNRTRKHIQRTAAMTYVRQLDAEVNPSPRAMTLQAANRCQVYEDFLALLIEQSRLVSAWDRANFNRCVVGDFGIGFFMRPVSATVGGSREIIPDALIKAFHFFPHELTLDPHCDEPKLCDHDVVGFSRPWSLEKVNRVLGDMLKKQRISIDPNECQMIGEISPFESNMYSLSGGRLFAQHKNDSKTRGLCVHQIHRKSGSEGDRFDIMEIVLQLPSGPRILNPDSRSSPWGGDGMPLGLLHAHPRGDCVWHESDVRGMKDDQDALNRTRTAFDRQLIHSSHLKWLVDRKGFSERNDEELARRFTNAIGGIIPYDSGSRESMAQAPQLVTVAPPSTLYMAREADLDSNMREMVHRAPVNDGELKSHTSAASVAIARDEAGLVSDKRVHQDTAVAESMCRTLLATGLRLVAGESPMMAKTLVEAEFSDRDIGILAAGEQNLNVCRVRIRPSSVRSRSVEQRVRAINDAVQQQMIDARTARRALADAGVDTPLTDDDAVFSRFFDEVALSVVVGEKFVPFNTGLRTDDLIDTLLRAMVKQPPEIRAALNAAIESQQMYMAQQAAALQAMATPPGAEMEGQAEQAGSAEQVAGSGDAVPMNEIIAALEQQVSARGAA